MMINNIEAELTLQDVPETPFDTLSIAIDLYMEPIKRDYDTTRHYDFDRPN